MDLVDVPARVKKQFATKAHAKAELEFKTRKALIQGAREFRQILASPVHRRDQGGAGADRRP